MEKDERIEGIGIALNTLELTELPSFKLCLFV
jgi:hypothetical protein